MGFKKKNVILCFTSKQNDEENNMETVMQHLHHEHPIGEAQFESWLLHFQYLLLHLKRVAKMAQASGTLPLI